MSKVDLIASKLDELRALEIVRGLDLDEMLFMYELEQLLEKEIG